jgi:hypothetical protein
MSVERINFINAIGLSARQQCRGREYLGLPSVLYTISFRASQIHLVFKFLSYQKQSAKEFKGKPEAKARSKKPGLLAVTFC